MAKGQPPRWIMDPRWSSQFARKASRSSSVSGRLRAGRANWGVRWNTVRCLAVLAISGMACMPEEPVPITATFFPSKDTGSWGQRPVW